MSTKFSMPFYKVLKGVASVLFLPISRIRFTNRNNVPADGRYIIAPNHISALDVIYITIGQKRPVRYMGKAELFRNKFIGWLLTKMGAFPVERGKGDWDSINNAKQMIDNGDLLGIFIEGTRSKTGELLRPKSGAVLIAHQMNCKIVPASITYRGDKRHFFSKIYVSFGEPVSTEELGVVNGSPREYREASRQLMDRIRVMWERDKYGN